MSNSWSAITHNNITFQCNTQMSKDDTDHTMDLLENIANGEANSEVAGKRKNAN